MSRMKWTPINDSRPRFERKNPQHYDSPQSEAYREGWERIFGQKEPSDLPAPGEDRDFLADLLGVEPAPQYSVPFDGKLPCTGKDCLCCAFERAMSEEASCPTTSSDS